MAESPHVEPGARFPKGGIDPDLVKLSRTRLQIGIITAAGIAFLCAAFLWKLAPDRHFNHSGKQPTKVAVADILGGKVETDSYIQVEAEPLVAHAIRTVLAKGKVGYRVVPARGTGDRLWIVLSGDGWEPAAPNGYVGRLRKLADLPLADSVTDYAAEHPRPVFASPAAVRAGFAANKVATVAGDEVAIGAADVVALDVIDGEASTIVASINERLPTAAAWTTALTAAGIAPTAAAPAPSDEALGQVRFDVTASVTATTAKLETAGLWAARVEPVTRHYKTTWGALRASGPSGLAVDGKTTIADAQLDLVGLYVARDIPGGAYALLVGEVPQDFWYVLPITIALVVIGLLFAWALVRAVRRDLLKAA